MKLSDWFSWKLYLRYMAVGLSQVIPGIIFAKMLTMSEIHWWWFPFFALAMIGSAHAAWQLTEGLGVK